jgi:hypothetical protein
MIAVLVGTLLSGFRERDVIKPTASRLSKPFGLERKSFPSKAYED